MHLRRHTVAAALAASAACVLLGSGIANAAPARPGPAGLVAVENTAPLAGPGSAMPAASRVNVSVLIGVTEAVSNALLHGRGLVTVRIWGAPDRIVINVHDQGHGPADPLAGLVPAPSRIPDAGLGLWLIHQLDIDVALNHAHDGFTVRLRGGATNG